MTSKTSPKSGSAALRSRLAEMSQRLEEAEQTLDAIRSGQVDALIVSGASGERVFTLQGADHRYRQIVEGMTEGALIVSAQGAVVYANAAFARLVATPLDRVFGSMLVEHVAAGSVAGVERLLQAARSGQSSAKTSLLASGGKTRPVHLSAAPDSGGEHDGVCVIVTDLTFTMRETDRQHADEFRQLVDNMPELAWHALPDGYIDFYNKRWDDYTGSTLKETQGWGWQALLDPTSRDAVTEHWARSIAAGVPFERELSLRGADGVYRWFLTRVRPLHDESGKIVRWFGTNTDIDGQKRDAGARAFLEQASVVLASSLDFEETLTTLAALPIPGFADLCSIYLKRADGSVAQVAVANESAAHAELVRNVHRQRKPSPSATLGHEHVLLSGCTELVEHVTMAELRAVAQDEAQLEQLQQLGLTSWVGVPLKVRAETLGVLFFARTTGRAYSPADLPLIEELAERAAQAWTKARLYEDAQLAAAAERQARDKADAATRLKDEFLATLSHELRTPLNAILGWARMLQSDAVDGTKRSRGIDTIVRNAIAQNQLIEDLLDVSRIISGKMRMSVDFVDIAQVVTAAIDVVQPAADAKGVRLQSLLDPDAGLISGDAARLQQVIWNLLTNAVKFTPRGGRIHIQLRREESHVELTVADTGAGIDPDFLPHVFDRFRQQDAAITRKAGGLGLGLAIVKSLTELHGGRVDVASAGPDQGATFTVRIPVSPVRSTPVPSLPVGTIPPPRVEAAPLSCPSQIAALKILVLDDEPDARELLRTVFEQCGGVVTTASSAAEALSLVKAVKPDVIVSDIGMPGEDGYSFIKKLRARSREAGGRTPAVALTAYARAEDRTRALVEGFNSHTSKPVDPHELLVVVANLARHQ